MKIKFEVNESCDLFTAISKAAPIGASSVKRLIKGREAKVNGERVGQNIKLNVKDEVECFIPQSFLGEGPKVIYEDENILIVDKPVLIEVVPTLRDKLRGDKSFLMPIHRIDRNTIGLVAFAKNEPSYEMLTDAIKRHKVIKRYSALVLGTPKEGEYEAYLLKDASNSLCHISALPLKGYKKIVTIIERVEPKGDKSFLTLRLVTGRTHQIRAHLAFLGFPVLGDGKYGNAESRKGGPYQKLCAQQLIFTGLRGNLRYLNEKVFVSEQKIID